MRTSTQQELGNVVGVQGRGSGWETRWQISVTKTSDPIGCHNLFVGNSGFDISTSFGSQIDSHTTRLHLGNHLLGDHSWGRATRNQSSGDDNINVLTLLCQHISCCSMPLSTHFLGISTSCRTIFFKVNFQELSTHSFNLFLGHWSNIKGSNDSSHVLGSLNSSQTSNSRTNDQYLGRRNLSSSSHLPSKEASKFIGSLQDGTVSRNVGLTGKSIVGLTSGESTWNTVHSKGSCLLILQLLDQSLILLRIQETNQCSIFQHFHFLISGWSKLQDNV
mmetsp:Transcript_8351/g.20093  ORF Transcript_8351/g.20093 Transcript_8351/m.20093 type:complete len:276 (+) Transcript_8351:2069-2896(+)